MRGWHFSDGYEAYGEKRRIEAGVTLTVKGPTVLCQHGLHASVRAIDALRYASGPIVSYVELGGTVIEDTDKVVATQRTHLAVADATELLHEFACWCAEQALLAERVAGHEPDPRSWAAIEAKRAWLRHEISDDALAAASAAAWPASAVWSASQSAWSAELEQRLSALLGLTPGGQKA